MDNAPHVVAHYHHIWAIWSMFYTGLIVHLLFQTWRLSIDGKATKAGVLEQNWIPMLVRSFLDAVAFALIWLHPEVVSQISGFFGHQISADEAAAFSLPMNNALAALYGFFLDSGLGYIPWFKTQLCLATTTQVKQTTVLTQTVETSQKP